MLNYSSRKISLGFSLLEFMVVIILIVTLTKLAIPNFIEFRHRGYDASAYQSYKKLKEQLQNLQINSSLDQLLDSKKPFLIFNFRGYKNSNENDSIVKFPEQVIEIPKDVIVHYAFFIPNQEDSNLDKIALEVSHAKGNTYYRFYKQGSKFLEQKVKKNR